MTIRTSSEAVTGGVINLLGPSGSGKTFAAATFSEHFPHQRVAELTALAESGGPDAVIAALAKLPWVTLADMLWVPFDEGALDGLAAFKIAVPYVPFLELESKNTDVDERSPAFGLPIITRINALVQQEIDAHVAKTPACKAIVCDTISNMDLTAQAYIFNRFTKPLCYNEMDKVHKTFYARVRGAAPWSIYNFHLQALTEPLSVGESADAKKQVEETKLRSEALKMAGGGKLTLAIHNKSRPVYQTNGSNQIGVEAKRSMDGKRIERWLLTETVSASGVEARVRADILVAPRELVDIRRLLKRMGKI